MNGERRYDSWSRSQVYDIPEGSRATAPVYPPQDEGALVHQDTSAAAYLLQGGQRHRVPDTATYSSIYSTNGQRDWSYGVDRMSRVPEGSAVGAVAPPQPQPGPAPSVVPPSGPGLMEGAAAQLYAEISAICKFVDCSMLGDMVSIIGGVRFLSEFDRWVAREITNGEMARVVVMHYCFVPGPCAELADAIVDNMADPDGYFELITTVE